MNFLLMSPGTIVGFVVARLLEIPLPSVVDTEGLGQPTANEHGVSGVTLNIGVFNAVLLSGQLQMSSKESGIWKAGISSLLTVKLMVLLRLHLFASVTTIVLVI
jgi:hypothetical protein